MPRFLFLRDPLIFLRLDPLTDLIHVQKDILEFSLWLSGNESNIQDAGSIPSVLFKAYLTNQNGPDFSPPSLDLLFCKLTS